MRVQTLQVLLLTNTAAPYRQPLFEALAEYWDLTVCLCQSNDADRYWRSDLRSERVRYIQLPFRLLSLPGGRGKWVWNPGLSVFLRTAPFDVYIAGENFRTAPSVLTVWRAARRENSPFILWSGAIDTPYASGHWVSNAYRRWLYRRTDAFIAYGEKAAAFLMRRGVPSNRIYSGTQGIVPGWIWSVPADKEGLGLGGQTVLLYVGYLVPRKGVADLISAYRRVRRPRSVLVIVGDGPQRAELEALAGGEEDIRFVGYLEGEAKWRYYASADLFVLPTYHDPWPQAINEALYFGLPVITTDRDGSVGEVVRENGIVVPAGDVDALADALDQLLSDGALRQKMGCRSREIIAGYTVERARNTFLRAVRYALEECAG